MKRPFKTRVLDNKLKKFETAVEELAFIGSMDPDDHPAIEANYKKRRLDLWSYILEFALHDE
jgi:hypothetical protein